MANVQEILAPDKARVGSRKTAIYAGPRWVRPDGNTWRRIDEVVSVQQLAGGGYRLAYGEAWVELRPDAGSSAALAAATKRVIVGGRAFGPILDVAKAPDSLVWRVTASPGVKRRKDLWLLGEPDGVALGLHLQDWRRRFGPGAPGLVVEGDRITLDLTEAKANAAEGNGEINLDPELSPGAQSGLLQTFGTPFEWPTIPGSDPGQGTDYMVDGLTVAGIAWEEHRTYLRFDTNGLGDVGSAVLTMTPSALKVAAVNSVRVTRIPDYTTFGSGIWNNDYWDSGPSVACSGMTEDVAANWTIGVGDIETADHTCFQIHMLDEPVTADPGEGAEFYRSGSPPVLTIEEAGGSGGMMRIGMGR